MLPLALALCLASALPQPAPPPFKVAGTTLGDLTARATLVVVGEVAAVQEDWRNASGASYRVAEVRVSRVLKGDADLRSVRYVAQGTWTCDITGGDVGERGVYFLCESKLGATAEPAHSIALPVYAVAHSGRGRMELRTIDGAEYATVWSGDVLLPQSLRTVDGPEPRYTFIRSVPLTELQHSIEVFDDVQSRPAFAVHATPRSASEDALSFTIGRRGGCLLGKFVQDVSASRSRYGPTARLFRLDEQRLESLLQQLAEEKVDELPALLGERTAQPGTRYVDCWTASGKRSTRIDTITEAWMSEAGRADATRRGIRAWTLLRAAADEARLADWSEADRRWLR